MKFYLINANELHTLFIGRNIAKNLHMVEIQTTQPYVSGNYREPLYDVHEFPAIAPTDFKKLFDMRLVIGRIVDGSEFDELKKLYGTMRHLNSFKPS